MPAAKLRASFDRVSVLLDSVTPIELTRQRLKLDLIGDVQSIVHLNPKISNSALQLRVAENCTARKLPVLR